MAHVLSDAVVDTDYGQFDLVWSDEGGFDGDFQRFFSGQVNGLVGAADRHGVHIILARRSGGSRVQIQRLQVAPTIDDGFEDVVEVSVTVPPGAEPRWTTWAGESSGSIPELEPGTYRMRVSAIGRDAGHQHELSPTVVDEYLIEMWLAERAPDAILRSGSADAAYWHNALGEPRP